jgi:hypothetical protein
MKINKLNWNTEFFEIKTGKIEINKEHEFDPLKFEETVK